MLERLAGAVAVSLIASHRVAVERFRLNQLNLVREVSAQIANVLNVDELASRVTQLIQQTFHYYYVAIFTLQDGSTSLRIPLSAMWTAPPQAASQGALVRQTKASVALEVEIGQGLIGQAAAEGERILVDDVKQDPRYRFIDSLPETRSEVVLPLKMGDRVLGVLDVQSDQPHAFHPNDLLILGALADTIARAVEGARLYSDLRRRADQLTLVAEVSKSVSSSLELHTLMDNAAALIHDRFGYPYVHLFTVHPNRRLIEYQAGSGARSKVWTGYTFSLDDAQGIIPWVAREGQTVLANDVKKDKRYRPSPLPPEDTNSELCVPLIYPIMRLSGCSIFNLTSPTHSQKMIALFSKPLPITLPPPSITRTYIVPSSGGDRWQMASVKWQVWSQQMRVWTMCSKPFSPNWTAIFRLIFRRSGYWKMTSCIWPPVIIVMKARWNGPFMILRGL